jgi:hypothetical protein
MAPVMDIRQLLGRGIQETKFEDKTMSYTGLQDFKEEKPEILKMGPKAPLSRPRTRASQNNSYT